MDSISKGRKTEIVSLMKKKTEKDVPSIIGTSGMDLITLGLVDAFCSLFSPVTMD